MRILTLTATEFGLFKNQSFTLDRCMTLIEGANESGKSTLQALVVFLLYGFPARDQNERTLRLSRDGKRAAGEMTLSLRGTSYRICRTYLLRSLSGRTAPLEVCEVTDAAGERVDLGGKQPGEYFLGIPREIYEATALSRQSEIEAVASAATGDAVSNLLFPDTCGAGLDTATRLLDAARRELTHTRGRGGLLDTLATERAMLEGDLQNAREHSGKLRDLRAKAAAFTADLQDKEHALNMLSAAARAGELDAILTRFAALHAAEDEENRLTDALQATADTAQAPRPSAEIVTALGRAVSLRESLLAERDGALARAREAEVTRKTITENALYGKIEALGGAETLDSKLNKLTRRTARLTALALLLLAAGAGIMALAFAPLAQALPFYAVGSGCVLSGLVSLIGRWQTGRRLRALCRTLGVRTKQLLPTMLATHIDSRNAAHTASHSASTNTALAETLTDKLSALDTELRATATSLGIPADVAHADLLTYALAMAATDKKASSESAALQAALAASRARREMLAASLNGLCEADIRRERDALTDISPLTAEEVTRHRAFLEEAKAGLTANLLAVSREEAALAAKETDVAALERALAENKDRMQKASDKLAAIRLAQEVLTEASDALQSDLLPRIVANASRILHTLTGGKYGKLFLNADFAVSLEADGGVYPLRTFSAGCRDAVGLALRLALTAVVGAEPLPLLLDEVTARLDDIRAANLLSCLTRLTEGDAQILLFTCHSREAKMLDAAGISYTAITLSQAPRS